jgi:hypothetical protein
VEQLADAWEQLFESRLQQLDELVSPVPPAAEGSPLPAAAAAALLSRARAAVERALPAHRLHADFLGREAALLRAWRDRGCFCPLSGQLLPSREAEVAALDVIAEFW